MKQKIYHFLMVGAAALIVILFFRKGNATLPSGSVNKASGSGVIASPKFSVRKIPARPDSPIPFWFFDFDLRAILKIISISPVDSNGLAVVKVDIVEIIQGHEGMSYTSPMNVGLEQHPRDALRMLSGKPNLDDNSWKNIQIDPGNIYMVSGSGNSLSSVLESPDSIELLNEDDLDSVKSELHFLYQFAELPEDQQLALNFEGIDAVVGSYFVKYLGALYKAYPSETRPKFMKLVKIQKLGKRAMSQLGFDLLWTIRGYGPSQDAIGALLLLSTNEQEEFALKRFDKHLGDILLENREIAAALLEDETIKRQVALFIQRTPIALFKDQEESDPKAWRSPSSAKEVQSIMKDNRKFIQAKIGKERSRLARVLSSLTDKS